MPTFTIDTDNNITAHAELPQNADVANSFCTAKELTKLTVDWPAARLVDTWNSFAGVAPFDDLKPVKKFMDRKAAVGRIWHAIQRLTPADGEQAADIAPPVEEEPQDSSKGKKRAQAKKASAPKSARKKADASEARDGSKKAIVLSLVRRPKGATLTEIKDATGWQA